jgi:hypothetical protein
LHDCAKLYLWPRGATQVIIRDISREGYVRFLSTDARIDIMLTDEHIHQIGQAVREHWLYMADKTPKQISA